LVPCGKSISDVIVSFLNLYSKSKFKDEGLFEMNSTTFTLFKFSGNGIHCEFNEDKTCLSF